MIVRITALCLLLTACGARGAFVALPPEALADRPSQTIYLATNRTGPLALAEVDVLLTPDRDPGEVAFSGRNAFGVSGATSVGRADLLQSFDAASSPDDPIGIFIHGYNNTSAEAVYRHAQMARDFGAKGPQITFAWPSLARALGYVGDRDAALRSRDTLEDLLLFLSREQEREITLVAHSMGSFLLMETFRQMAQKGIDISGRIDSVILISPDIDVELFRSQIAVIDTLPEPFVVVISERDRILGISARLAGRRPRLGAPNDVSELTNLDITVIDVTNTTGGDRGGHLQAASSPTAIAWLRSIGQARLRD